MENGITVTWNGSSANLLCETQSHLARTDGPVFNVRAEWDVLSLGELPQFSDMRTTFVFPGILESFADDANAHYRFVETEEDEVLVRKVMEDNGCLVSLLACHMGWSVRLFSGWCQVNKIENVWDGPGTTPRIIMCLVYKSIMVRETGESETSFATLERLERELVKISQHYLAASETNFAFVSLTQMEE